MTMDKLKVYSTDVTQDNIAKIRNLFPACVKESAGGGGSSSIRGL